MHDILCLFMILATDHSFLRNINVVNLGLDPILI